MALMNFLLFEIVEKYPKYEIPAKFEAAIKLAKKILSEGKESNYLVNICS
jgi:hypothetical protein